MPAIRPPGENKSQLVMAALMARSKPGHDEWKEMRLCCGEGLSS